MELKVYDPGLFIEELVFQIKQGLVQRYVELEYEIMAKKLQHVSGFSGWQIWESETNAGEVTSLYYWKDYESYKNIDQVWLKELKFKMIETFGEENCQFVKAGHEENKRFQLRSLV